MNPEIAALLESRDWHCVEPGVYEPRVQPHPLYRDRLSCRVANDGKVKFFLSIHCGSLFFSDPRSCQRRAFRNLLLQDHFGVPASARLGIPVSSVLYPGTTPVLPRLRRLRRRFWRLLRSPSLPA